MTAHKTALPSSAQAWHNHQPNPEPLTLLLFCFSLDLGLVLPIQSGQLSPGAHIKKP